MSNHETDFAGWAAQLAAQLLVSIGTFFLMFRLYYKPTLEAQTTIERARLFFEWNKWFDSEDCAAWKADKDDPNAKSLLDVLIDSQADSEVSDDEREAARATLRRVPIARKEAVLAFFEQLAISVNTGLLKPEAANYMFGYYAVMIKDTPDFWSGGLANEGDEWFWKVFNSFVEDMKRVQNDAKNTTFDPRQVKL